MARLICTDNCSLDGYVADASGSFDWSVPDPQVHAFINDLERPIGTYLYGRRLYEVMLAWEDLELDGQPAEVQDYASLWRAADKVVYSRTLDLAASVRTRVEHEFDAERVRELVAQSPRDVGIGGPELAAHAVRAGMVDEFRLFLNPVVVGGGKRCLPDDVRLDLELLDERGFDSGVVYLCYGRRA